MSPTLFVLCKQMREMVTYSCCSFGCCCCCRDVSSCWEQTLKAHTYMGAILSVSHTVQKDPADCAGQPSKMDISLLEEQYYSIKQKQKLHTHIIVYKTGNNNPIPRESLVNTIALNKRSQKLKAFNAHIPVRRVTLDVSGNCSPQDRDAPWHTHLDIHRLVQVDYQNMPNDAKPDMNTGVRFGNERLSYMENVHMPYDKSAVPSEPSQEEKTELVDSSRLLNNSTEESQITFPRIKRKSLKSITPIAWASHPSTKLISESNKYYPFPQKKTPKISEAARRLGLYVTH
ncbi:uncharacterized protein C9orf152 homolog [Rhinatrema bivittatum]|uniref:uncharacterized protein C9orf152 homolog n=1 Tax=Rhinatrema bivittatum TaxID=194408 RepID=UPI00112ACDF5|nr:uncharacterized protein C9orf152 homolog [Rhinatrema bivittatum]